MKLHLLQAEHFAKDGRIVRVFADHASAARAGADLVNTMLSESRHFGLGFVATPESFDQHVEMLQDEYGAAHCYVEIVEAEIESSMAFKGYEPADPAEIETARSIYADDDLEIDDDATVSRAVEGYWVSAWVWIANDDVEG